MPRGRQQGVKNRNYPAVALEEALAVATAIQDEASASVVSKLTLAVLISKTPSSSQFRDLVSASRMYGLTNGGVNAEEFSLTDLGMAATGGDEVAREQALKGAVMNVPPFERFLVSFNTKKIPAAAVLKEFLVKNADVDSGRAAEAMETLQRDLDFAGLVTTLGNGKWIELSGAPASSIGTGGDPEDVAEGDPPEQVEPNEQLDAPQPSRQGYTPATIKPDAGPQNSSEPRKVFIAHGKNRTPLDQLKKMLDQFKVKYAVAVDEPNTGRPISKKVADLMTNECSSGIFIFTADERFLREDSGGSPIEVWRPSENVVYELGAASILYDNRIVIFKEQDVSFPSDFSDLGYISFKKDELVNEMGHLFSELVSLDILEVRAKG